MNDDILIDTRLLMGFARWPKEVEREEDGWRIRGIVGNDGVVIDAYAVKLP